MCVWLISWYIFLFCLAEKTSPSINTTSNSPSVEHIIAEMERTLSAEKIEQNTAQDMVDKVNKLLNISQLQISSMSKRYFSLSFGEHLCFIFWEHLLFLIHICCTWL